MWFRSRFDVLSARSSRMPARQARRDDSRRRPTGPRLGVEALDDRCLPSTFTVLNLLDSGAGSLRAAVAAANASPGADTIDFATTGTIGLTSGQLDITDGVTINGPGAAALTVSGNHTSRVFGIAGNPTVTIANLTVANGWTGYFWNGDWWNGGTPPSGGGIYVAGGNLTLDHVAVSGNLAFAGGGGLFVAGGNLTLDHSTLSSNEAVSNGFAVGGGLCVKGGVVDVKQSTISGNFAMGYDGNPADGYNGVLAGDGVAAEGGGLYVYGGTVFIDNSTFSGNWAQAGNGGAGDPYYYYPGGSGGSAAGGGIRIAAGMVYLNQSTISGNSVTGGYGESGSGVGVGGGLNISPAAPPLANLDTFTESNTVNNTADIDPNISGPYSLNGSSNPALAISDVSTSEGNTGTTAFVFTVRLTATSNQAVTVNYATADGSATAGSDYQTAAGTLTIPAGQTTGTITVLVNGDRLVEPNETFVVNLSSSTNAIIVDGTGVGTIVDDEPRISISDTTVTEGNTGGTNATFTVTLSAAYDVPVTVNYATADGTATAGSDYQAAAGALTFAPGETSKTVTVQVLGDRLGEWNETFFVNLSSPTNGVVTDGQGVGTIVDNEPWIYISDVTKSEGKKGQTTSFTFTVTLSAAYDQPVTMSFKTTDGTAKTSDNDYVAKTGTITFAPGQTSKTITIVVNGDSKREADEVFYLDLFGNSSNSLFSKSRGIGTILNDD
jgi:hypothetical protein